MNKTELNKLYNNLKKCDICPRDCLVNRYVGIEGTCGVDKDISLSSFGPHYGEEPELVGPGGSGTIFFAGCNLKCEFCQNHDISHKNAGVKTDEHKLAQIMLHLQEKEVSNINLVTPTHYTPQIIKAIMEAKKEGLSIPIVYNSSGYDKVETLKYFDGLIDIYMPDLKFYDHTKSKMYCTAPDYFDVASLALEEMYRQVGDLLIVEGKAIRGLMIRHLVMPADQSDTKKIIDYIASIFSTETYLNLMDQYRPEYRAESYCLIDTRIERDYFDLLVEYAKKKGFYRPDFIYSE